MKKTIIKRVFAFVSALIIGGIALISTPANVKANALVESVKAMGQNAWYRALIEEQSGYKGQRTNFLFDVVDMDGDGGLDLLFSVYDTNLQDTIAWAASYNKYISSNGQQGFTSDSREFYYCTETGYTKVIRRYENWDVTFYEEMFGDLGNYVFYKTDFEGNYVEFDNESDNGLKIITDEATIAQYESWKTTYMPTSIPGLGKYEATEENLDKLLPIKESDDNTNIPTGEYTLNPVNLKVGEVFALSNSNIDKLISNEVVELNNGLQKLYFGDNVTADTNFVSKTLYYAFYDAATLKEVIKEGYWTAEESNAFFETGKDGKWFYEGQEVIPVEEGEAVAYYNIRADKAGSTTVTIADYKIGDATIKLTIPFNIIETSGGVPGTPAVPETPVENVITSTTDATVTVADSANVLPAGTSMTTAKVESGTVYDEAVKVVVESVEDAGKVAVYEINLSDANNVELHQLEGKVKVTMNVPFTVEAGKTIKVYRVEGNELIPCVTTVSGDKLTFETDHFSTYVFVEETVASNSIYYYTSMNTATTGVVTAPKTGDVNVALMVAMFAVATAGVIIVRRRVAR